MNTPDPVSQWPRPAFAETSQPHFLFIVTPPMSGSTAMAEVLNSSARTTLLQERGEGQWLVPGLCADDRWNSSMFVDFESVKAVWLSTYAQMQAAAPLLEVVIEKSPPNMVRIEQLAAQFRSVSFLANNRDPYANCASILYRNYAADQLSAADRSQVLTRLTHEWVLRSEKISELVLKLHIPLLTYEKFCESPKSILQVLALPGGVAESIDTSAVVKVKDYPLQGIVNQNERQLALLSSSELATISKGLQAHSKLLEFFGYQLR